VIRKVLKSFVQDYTYYTNFRLTVESVIPKSLRDPQSYEIRSELTESSNLRFVIYDTMTSIRCCVCTVMFGRQYIEERNYF